MKSKKTLQALLQAVLTAAALSFLPSCGSMEDEGPTVATPKDNVSGLPWDRPAPGEDAQRFGALPQSH